MMAIGRARAAGPGGKDPETPIRWGTRHGGTLTALLLFAFIWPIVISARVFPDLSVDADEGVYLQQADALYHGRVTVPAPPRSDPLDFVPWFNIVRGRSFVPKYPPVFASYLAVTRRLFFGYQRASLGLLLAASVAIVYGLARRWLPREPSLLAAAAFLSTPFVLIQSGVFLGYLFGTTLIAAMVLAMASALAPGRGGKSRPVADAPRPWPLVGAGALGGLCVFARPLDGLLAVGSAGLIAAYLIGLRWGAKVLLRSGLLLGSGAAGPLLAMAIYNKRYFGGPTKLGYTAFAPWDRPGFGVRGQLPIALTNFTVKMGITSQWKGLRQWLTFGPGGPLVLVLVGLGIAALVRRRLFPLSVRVLTSVAVGNLVAYVGFWSTWGITNWEGSRLLGPLYQFPLTLIVAMLCGLGLWRLPPRWRIALGLAAVGVGGFRTTSLVRDNLEATHRWRADRKAIGRLPRNALVVYPLGPPAIYVQLLDPSLRNRIDDGGRQFMLARNDAAVIRAVSRSSHRPLYLYDRSGFGDLRRGRLTVGSLEMGTRLAVDVDITVPLGATRLRAQVLNRGKIYFFELGDPPAGTRRLRFELSTTSATIDGRAPQTGNVAAFTLDIPVVLGTTVQLANGLDTISELRLPADQLPGDHFAVLLPGHVWATKVSPTLPFEISDGPLAFRVARAVMT